MSKVELLVVIPCLNEVEHIALLLDSLSDLKNVEIVVVDGGSTDGTKDIVLHSKTKVTFLENPKKIQSAGVNLAVQYFGDNTKYLVRLDVHAEYPVSFIQNLISEADETKADSIVVSMDTVGKSSMQRGIAAAQNSVLGNGGAAHRNDNPLGQWIDHGHHALMLLESFREVGGYDESFVANEDAELDFRLIQAGYRIWLTAKTKMTYYPRTSLISLFSQYYRYGLGRASNILKHRQVPKVRQMMPVLVFPSLLLSFLGFAKVVFLLPFMSWLLMCLCFGFWLAFKNKDISLVLAGPAAATMHLGWSVGFLQKLSLFCFRSIFRRSF